MSELMIGVSTPRVDARAKVTGAATYVPDIVFPGMLHAAVVRAGVPRAVLNGIDTDAAREMPGVRAVVTGEGCTMLFGTALRDQPPIAVDKVRHAGEAVAVVLAETPLQARAAARKVKPDLSELPFVLDPREAAGPDAPIIHEHNGEYRRLEYSIHPEPGTNVFHHYKLRKGDAARSLEDADVIVEEEFTFPLSSHAAIEPHAAIARFEPEGNLEVWASNQAPFVVRDVLAEMFEMPSASVRVHVPSVGGGFGGKSDVCIEPLVAYAASFVPGRWVKLVLSRQEVFTSSLLGRGMTGRMKLGATSEGTLVGLKAEMHFADGAYGDTSWPVCTVAGHNCAAALSVPNAHVDVYGVYTNSPPVGAYRGYGHPEGQFMSGRLMHMLARKLGMSHADLLRKNLLRAGDRNLLGQEIHADTGDLEACLQNVVNALEQHAVREDDRQPGLLYGSGIALLAKSPKMSPSASSGCHITVDADGSVFVNLAGIEMGQGSATVFAQMTAEALGIPVDRVSVYRDVDTQNAPWDWQTVASMQTYRGGRAIQDACSSIVEQLRQNAALVFECDEDEVEYAAGDCCRRGVPGERLAMGELARGYVHENGLTIGKLVEAVGSYRVQGVVEPDPETGMGNAAGSWTFGAEGANVAIDPDAGEIRVLHFAVSLDPGRVINPRTARGQVTGAVVQGLGATLMEEVVFREDGTIRNTNFGKYRVPRASDAPGTVSVDFVETPNETGPWGAKPLGEHPIVAVAPAVLNAISDACGVEFTHLPVTPEILKDALEGGAAQRATAEGNDE